MANIYIGISGWRYAPWRGVFYPKGLPQARELEFASRVLSTVEINGSFYSLQPPQSYAAWYEATPPGFVFSVKGNRFLTHTLRLRDMEKPLANVLSSGIFNLREKLGPMLWQLPPNFVYDQDRLEHFFALLPHETESALKLARRHEALMKGRVALSIDANRPLRHAIEVRHPSFADPSFIALLRRYGVALVVADTAGKWPYMEDVTADFMYLRLHGDVELYASGYSEAALDRWTERIRAWNHGREPQDAHRVAGSASPAKYRDVYCYFDNDIKVHAPFDARNLMAKLGLDAGLEQLGERGKEKASARTSRPLARPWARA